MEGGSDQEDTLIEVGKQAVVTVCSGSWNSRKWELYDFMTLPRTGEKEEVIKRRKRVDPLVKHTGKLLKNSN